MTPYPRGYAIIDSTPGIGDMNQLLGGRYQFIRVLKSNAVGQTYLAEDTQGEQPLPCIVKRLQIASRNPRTQRFVSVLLKKKAETLSNFTCSQVPKILDFFEEAAGFYIIEEYIEGRPLSDLFAQGRPWDEGSVIQLLHDILNIVATVHSWGVIHRCIEPAHLIRRESDQQWVLIGFGIFHEISTQVMRSQTPPSSPLLGEASIYRPTEQTQGQLQFSSDIYAVGMIGIQAITGLSSLDLMKLRDSSTATNGSKSPQILWRDQGNLSDDLAEILDRMVCPAVHQRYQLVSDVLNDLQRLRRQETALGASTSLGDEAAERSRTSTNSTNWMRPLGLGIIAILGVAALMYSQIPQRWLAQRSLQRATNYQQSGATDKALAQYEQAITLQPSGQAFYERGMLHQSMGNTQAALEDLSQAIQLSPDNSNFHYQRGNIRFGLGDSEGAIADYTEAIQKDPNMSNAYVNRGSVRADLGDDQGAIADYTAALQVDPNLSAAYLNRCLSRSNLGEHQSAIADCSQAIRLQPNSVLAYQNRGLVRRRIGDTRGAIEDFNIAIRLDPLDADPYYNRGLARYELGDRMGAIADYTEAIQRNPDHVFAYYDRAGIYAADNNLAAALDDFQQAAKLCLDAGRTRCYEDAQYQIRQLQAQEASNPLPEQETSSLDQD